MTAVRLSDHSPVDRCPELCREMQERIDRQECRLVDLLEEGDRPRTSPEIFRLRGKQVFTREYAGLFEYRGSRVVIGSRFDGERAYFLWYLLSLFLGESILSEEDVGARDGEELFDALLAAKLALEVQRAWRKGGLRAYRRVPHNDAHLRGQLDIPRHIRENQGRNNGRAAYWTRPYTMDNDWNALVLQARAALRRRHPQLLHKLERKLPGFQTALEVLGQETPGWAGAGQVLSRTSRPISNPVFRCWEPVRRTARAVLRRMGADLRGTGEDRVVTGIFVDIDRLWERLLEEKLFAGAPAPFAQQYRDLFPKRMAICPDFYVPGVVLDAKNRRAWEKTLSAPGWWSGVLSKEELHGAEANVYQVLAYMLALNCETGGVIFPASGKLAPVQPLPHSIGGSGRQFWRVPVYIPRADSYPQFRQQMDAQLAGLRALPPIRQAVEGSGLRQI